VSDSVERLLIRIDATSEQLRRELKIAEKSVESSNNAMIKAQQDMAAKMNAALKNTPFFNEEATARLANAQGDFAKRLKAGLNESVQAAHAAGLKMNEQFNLGTQWSKDIEKANSGYTKFFTGVKSGFTTANQYVVDHNNEIKLLGAAAFGGLALAVKGIISYSDSYKNLQGQLKLVTSSQDELNRVYAATKDLAKETGASLESTVNLYARISRATEQLGLSEKERLRITESINKAMIVSGASAQEAEAAIRQLSQGMASGVLRGEELNSVMENSPRLAKALADGLGVPIGELRKMGAEGELTSEKVTGALLQMGNAIDSEFEKMPMTVARAMNSIQVSISDAVGKADLSPMVDSLHELDEALNNPEVLSGITQIATGLVTLAVESAKAVAALGSLTKWAAEQAASSFGPAADDMARMADKIQVLTEQMKLYKEAGAENDVQARKTAEELKKLQAVYDLNLELINGNVKATKEQVKTTEQLAPIIVTATKRTTEQGKALSNVVKFQSAASKEQERAKVALEKTNKEIEDYLDSLDDEIKMVGMSKREQEIFNAIRLKGANATDAQKEAIREKVGALYDEKEAIKATEQAQREKTKAEEEAARASEEAAQKTAQAWDESRQVLSDFFFEFAKDGENAFDTLVEGFKAMLVKMIAEAAANQIILGVQSVFPGLGGLVGGLTGAGGTGATGGGLSGLMSGGMSQFGSGLYESAGNLLSNAGFEGLGDSFYNKSLNTTGWTMAGDVAGGLAGGYLGNKVFGETSGIGATLGGFAGSALIPIPGVGAAVGSFLGSGLESLFGGKNNGNNTGYANFDLGSGDITSGGVGKSYDPANVSGAESLANQLKAMAEKVGGSTFKGRVEVSSNGGIKFDNKSYGKDVTKFLEDAFVKISAAAVGLDENLKDVISSFDGTSEEAVAFADAMVSLNSMLDSNPVQVAMEDFASSQERAGNTLASVYSGQLDSIAKLIGGYDGSAASTIALNAAMVENKNTAYQLAVAIKSVSEQIGVMFAQSAQQIRESVLTEEQKIFLSRLKREQLRSSLDDLFDPKEIEATAKEIDRLNTLIFNSLSQEQQKVQAESFAQYAEQTNRIAQTQLTSVLESARLSQEALNTQMANILQSAGTDMRASADTFFKAALIIAQAADRFQAPAQLGEVA